MRNDYFDLVCGHDELWNEDRVFIAPAFSYLKEGDRVTYMNDDTAIPVIVKSCITLDKDSEAYEFITSLQSVIYKLVSKITSYDFDYSDYEEEEVNA